MVKQHLWCKTIILRGSTRDTMLLYSHGDLNPQLSLKPTLKERLSWLLDEVTQVKGICLCCVSITPVWSLHRRWIWSVWAVQCCSTQGAGLKVDEQTCPITSKNHALFMTHKLCIVELERGKWSVIFVFYFHDCIYFKNGTYRTKRDTIH